MVIHEAAERQLLVLKVKAKVLLLVVGSYLLGEVILLVFGFSFALLMVYHVVNVGTCIVQLVILVRSNEIVVIIYADHSIVHWIVHRHDLMIALVLV